MSHIVTYTIMSHTDIMLKYNLVEKLILIFLVSKEKKNKSLQEKN